MRGAVLWRNVLRCCGSASSVCDAAVVATTPLPSPSTSLLPHDLHPRTVSAGLPGVGRAAHWSAYRPFPVRDGLCGASRTDTVAWRGLKSAPSHVQLGKGWGAVWWRRGFSDNDSKAARWRLEKKFVS